MRTSFLIPLSGTCKRKIYIITFGLLSVREFMRSMLNIFIPRQNKNIAIRLMLTVLLVPVALYLAELALAQELFTKFKKSRIRQDKIRAVVIDPADYLASEPNAGALAKRLVKTFKKNNVNLVYVNAYNVEYGAYYKTKYKYNFESEYGKQDFLGKLITTAHRDNIEVFAALYDHQHRGAWEAKSSWRSKTKNGDDYNPPVDEIQYYLSAGHPKAKSWCMGFLKDLLKNYPNLDGIELREPIINWGGAEADYNPAVNKAFLKANPGAALGNTKWHNFRRLILTRFLQEEIALIRTKGLKTHVTTVSDAFGTGKLLTAEEQAYETGFDLNALLNSKARPDAIKIQLIWQQWARVYDYIAFTPEWTGQATREFLNQVAGRAPVIVHVELTDFGLRKTSVDEFHRTLVAADLPEIAGLDFYSAFLANKKSAWPVLREIYQKKVKKRLPLFIGSDKRVLILYDEAISTPGSKPELSRLDAIYLANLLGHFKVNWKMQRIEDYKPGQLQDYDIVFYNATVYNHTPQTFLFDISVFDGQIVWIGFNLFQLKDSGMRIPIDQPTQNAVRYFNRIKYKGQSIPSKGSVIVSRAGKGVTVAAWTKSAGKEAPYILKNNKFWYVAGSPFEFNENINGRYIAFADLLHDMVKEFHKPKHQAFLRIEDVNPLTDPSLLRRITNVFYRRKVPFMVSLIPFYVDPDSKTKVALSNRPELVESLRYVVQKGGAIILHGNTHQYKDTTALDYEFWDPNTHRGVVKTEPHIRKRIEQSISEAWNNQLHPLAWETPHYSATPEQYALFGEYFSTFIEKRSYGSDTNYMQLMPYLINNDIYGGRVLSENLGYIRPKKENDDVKRMVANVKYLRVVRDSIAGGFFHVTISPKLIGMVIDQMSSMDSFIDLYSLPNTVKTSRGFDISGYGRADVVIPTGFYLQENLISKQGQVVESKLKRIDSYTRFSRMFNRISQNGIYSFRVLTESSLSLAARIRLFVGKILSRIIVVSTDPLDFLSYLITMLAVLVLLVGLAALIFHYLKRVLSLFR